MRRTLLAASTAAITMISVASAALPAAAAAGPALTIDITAGRHAISPHIYGMNFADEALANELDLPVRRWGGNATTRYHYLYDTTNRASDWFFENIAEENSNPALLPDGSSSDETVEQDRRTGTDTILTVPLIGWAPKARDGSCGFSVTKYGPQQSTDQFRPDCGNGVKPDGTPVTGNDPRDTSVQIGPAYITGWLGHLTGKYGTASQGGVKFYNLDNEPDIWHSTHRDVHPLGASGAELRDSAISIASAIKAADPGAMTLGPVGWGWTSWDHSGLDQEVCGRTGCWSSPPDRPARDGMSFAPWYLREMKRYDDANSKRLLDYFDMHFYPQASGVAFGNGNDPATNALRLRSTRALWDPSYVDESWINTQVRLVPRMKETINTYYPGTKTAITEYNWGALDHINGALTQADILGIFGREGLDLATIWAPPSAQQPGAFAFRAFRNFDGLGGKFGDISVSAVSGDQSRLAVYAAERTSDGTLTMVVVNKSAEEQTSPVSLVGRTNTLAKVYRYSPADLTRIVRQADQPIAANASFTHTFPANSITVLTVDRPTGDVVPPTQPGVPVASNVTPTSATLTWTPSTDNVGVAGYHVFRDGTQVATTATPSIALANLTPATTYVFTVRAFDPGGLASQPSGPLTLTTPPLGGVATCDVAYVVESQWPGGFTGKVTIRNTGTAAVDGWTLRFAFPATGQGLQQGWSATWTSSGANVTAAALDWNKRLAPNASTQIGFNGRWSGANPEPAAFTLNNSTCTVS
jgi:hypothetical protein